MVILLLTFVTIFLAVFACGVLLIHRLEQTNALSAAARRRGNAQAEADTTWRRRKEMLMG